MLTCAGWRWMIGHNVGDSIRPWRLLGRGIVRPREETEVGSWSVALFLMSDGGAVRFSLAKLTVIAVCHRFDVRLLHVIHARTSPD